MTTLFLIITAIFIVGAIFGFITSKMAFAGVLVVIGIWFIAMYNQFVQLTNRVKEAWSDIEVQMKRRYDLIPNLMETVKGYAAHEKDVFENVTKARAAAIGAQGMDGKAQAENMLSGALKSLFAVAEAYPQLRANENFLNLQNELIRKTRFRRRVGFTTAMCAISIRFSRHFRRILSLTCSASSRPNSLGWKKMNRPQNSPCR